MKNKAEQFTLPGCNVAEEHVVVFRIRRVNNCVHNVLVYGRDGIKRELQIDDSHLIQSVLDSILKLAQAQTNLSTVSPTLNKKNLHD